MKVAVATQDLTRIDAHLGWARHFLVYEVDAEGYRYLEMADFPGERQDGNHEKLVPRLKALEGCQMVFVADVGPDGRFGLARAKVIPICKFAAQPIATALESLAEGLRGRSLPWLRQAEQRYRQDSLGP